MLDDDKYAYKYCHNYQRHTGNCVLTEKPCEDEQRCELRKLVQKLDKWKYEE